MANPDSPGELSVGNSGVVQFGRKVGKAALDDLNFSWSVSNGQK